MFQYAKTITEDVYKTTREDLVDSANFQLQSKMRVGITNAISISNDQRIKSALAYNNRNDAIDSLKDISSNMQKYTAFKNIKIHIHTKENHSFLRNWKLEKYGDDLSSFRDAVVSVNKTYQPVSAFEPGREGLLLRAIVPIIDKDNKHLGSLEFIQGMNSVAKEFDKSEKSYLLLMDSQVSNDMKTGKDFFFKDNQKFKDYIISQKFINKSFLDDAQTINMQILFKNGFVLSSKYFYTYAPVKNFQNKNLGIVLLAKPLLAVNSTIEQAKTLIYISLFIILIMTFVVMFIIVLAVKLLITNPLKIFENGLSDFFLFLQGKKDFTQNIEINTDDEFGVMAETLKDNIAVSAKLHEEINDLNTNLEAKIEQKTAEVTTLLDNAGQGFLSFGCDLIIHEQYSKECIKLLGEDLHRKNIADLLFDEEAKQKFFKNTILEACRIDSNIVQNSILSLLPSEIILNRRALQLRYKILQNKSLMLIITNITAKKKLEKKVQQEQEVLKMIVEIISESDSFYDTKREYEHFIATYKESIDKNRTSLNNINEIYRTIHTLKGAFSQLYMANIVKLLHALESDLSMLIKKNEHTNEKLLSTLESYDYEANLQQEFSTIRSVLGDEFLDAQNFVKIDCYNIKKIQNKIKTVFEKENVETMEAKEIISELSHLSNSKLITLLRPYSNLIQQLASRFEKEVYPMEIICDEDISIDDRYKPFIKSLIHLFRNSMDHGIETPEKRARKDKDEIGTISCSVLKSDDTLQIFISDDGAGINKDEVLQKAIEQEILTQEKAKGMSEKDIFNLIFHERFSTKEEISEISGRGVGMSAVKAEIEKLGGKIEVTSIEDKGTTFVINIHYIDGEI
jgi:two-component system chemotaxis sensor kinase CheA